MSKTQISLGLAKRAADAFARYIVDQGPDADILMIEFDADSELITLYDVDSPGPPKELDSVRF